MARLGFVVAALGLVITGIGVLGVNVVFFRSIPKLMNRRSAILVERREGRGVPRADQQMAHEFALGLTLFAALAACGLTIMLTGFVLSGNVVNWAPLMPLALALLAVGAAMYSGWRLRQLKDV